MMPDVTPTYPIRVDGVEQADDSLVLHVSNVPHKERWGTLEGHMFTVRITSPADSVLRVQVTHYKGRRAPRLAFRHRVRVRFLSHAHSLVRINCAILLAQLILRD